jgi:altronate dehydratase
MIENFPKASVLRAEQDSYSTDMMKKVLQEIAELITKANNSHQSSIDVSSVFKKHSSWHMESSVKKYLTDPLRGFKVDDVGQYNEHYFGVSW